jgi:hypothetical protein
MMDFFLRNFPLNLISWADNVKVIFCLKLMTGAFILCVFLNLCKKLKYFFWVEDMLKLE